MILKQSMYTFKGVGYYWMDEKTVAKCLTLCNCGADFTSFSKFV